MAPTDTPGYQRYSIVAHFCAAVVGLQTFIWTFAFSPSDYLKFSSYRRVLSAFSTEASHYGFGAITFFAPLILWAMVLTLPTVWIATRIAKRWNIRAIWQFAALGLISSILTAAFSVVFLLAFAPPNSNFEYSGVAGLDNSRPELGRSLSSPVGEYLAGLVALCGRMAPASLIGALVYRLAGGGLDLLKNRALS
ncbi:hypothetical protein [Rhizobium sp. NRK18]|uniref:hypothetical protein n=1 Tax=Rhizobium sp. NRK18 TaxID=2964667 RepID=UPI0021C4665F|nr:hypothetical protein [Rhizobium sp. NRK18]MCQ2003452.1 hypothetical protein [Rhizobium sp. NRK18]